MENEPTRGEEQYARNEESDDPEVPPRDITDDAKSHNSPKNKSHVGSKIFIRLKWLAEIVWTKVRIVLASSSFWTAAATVAIAIETYVYTHYARQQWSVTEDQLVEMQSMDRPWMKIVDVIPSNGLLGDTMEIWDFTGTRLHNFHPARGTRVEFQASYKNVGHSPAFNVAAYYELYLPRLKGAGDSVLNEETRFCESNLPSSADWHSTLFPDEDFEGEHNFLQTEIGPNNSVTDSDETVFIAYLIVCVHYQIGGSAISHRTATIYEIVWNAPYFKDLPDWHNNMNIFSFKEHNIMIKLADIFFRRLAYADRAD